MSSSRRSDERPAHQVLAASVARRHYLDGRSNVQIAQEFALSRFQVARLLEEARRSGLVRIEIGHPGGIDVDLSGRLKDRFGLRHAVVVDTAEEQPVPLRRAVSGAAAELLMEVTTPLDVLGLAWARSVSLMTTALTRLPTVPVVQLTGALQPAGTPVDEPGADDSSVEIVRRAARVSRGPAYFFYSPFVLRDAASAAAMRGQPEVAGAMEQVASVTKAVVGVGRWSPGQSTLFDAAGPRERKALRDLGVHAEVSGVLIDERGEPVASELATRMIGITAADLTGIDDVIAIAYGTLKASAARAALDGRLVTSLVTHRSMAELLLSDPGDG